jgi:hypothetical protein
MYVKAKMITVETVPGIGSGGGDERAVGEGEFQFDILDAL